MIDDLKHDDHEGAMARSELYRAAKYAMKLFQMIEENQDLEGWVQSKITKSADYLDSVYHYMEYHLKFGGGHGAESLDDITKDAEDEIEDSLADAQATADAEEEIKLDETLTYEQKLHAILEGRVSRISEKKKCKSKKMEEEAVSKAQQRAAGAALAAKRGDIPKSKLKGASKEMAKMSKGDLEDFAGTKHKGLPQKVKEGNYYYDHDDDRSGSTGAVLRSNTPVYDKLIKDVAEKNPNVKTAKDFIDFYGDKINDVIEQLRSEASSRNASNPRNAANLLSRVLGELNEGVKPDYLDLDKDAKKKKIKENWNADRGPSEEELRAYYIKELTSMLDQVSEPWEKSQIQQRIDSVKRTMDGELPRETDGGPIEIKMPREWEKGLSNSRLLRIIRDDEGLSPEWKEKNPSALKRFLDFIGLEEDNTVKSVVKRVKEARKAKPDFLDVDKDGNKKEPMKKALKDKEKETVKESVELTRMKQFLTRLNG